MSWITDLAGKAEEFLNKVDQGAAQAFNSESKKEFQVYDKRLDEPTTANHNTNDELTRIGHSTRQNTPTVTPNRPHTPLNRNKGTDEELLDFLNSNNTGDNSANLGHRKTLSFNGNLVTENTVVVTKSGSVNAKLNKSSSGTSSGNEKPIHTQVPSTNDRSEHLNQNGVGSSSAESENRILHNELRSLNQELSRAMHRAKDAEAELNKFRQRVSTESSANYKQVSELQSQLADYQESVNAKDSQLAVLRVRIQEADQNVKAMQSTIAGLTKQTKLLTEEQNSNSNAQSNMVESLQEKIYALEAQSIEDVKSFDQMKSDTQRRIANLEDAIQTSAVEVANYQRLANEERKRNSDLNDQLQNVRSYLESSQKDLEDYKAKAQKTLAAKDNLIASLKNGDGVSSGEDAVSALEMEQLKHECDMLKAELKQSLLSAERLKAENRDLESQFQFDSENSKETYRSLEEQFLEEKRKRQDSELEIIQLKQDLKHGRDDFLSSKIQFQNRLDDRNGEIEKLRKQLTTKHINSTTNSDLEDRLHALTESLIQKQTTIEALSTDKTSLTLQLERNELQLRKVTMNGTSTSIPVGDIDIDSGPRHIPRLLVESPYDNGVTHRVKRAYNSIDAFSTRIGFFLRRYPVARLFVILYMFCLHLWVMIVLLTYTPEIHTTGFDHAGRQEPSHP